MKKIILYFIFSATTLHTMIGVPPVMAMSCNTHSNKAEVICEEGDAKCLKDPLDFNSK